MDFLKEAGQSCWQILPLGPIGYGDSPYQSFSSFAGNPYYISLEKLISYGWLTEEECESVDWGADERYVDYGLLYENRSVLLRKAFQKSGIEDDPQFRKFQEEEKDWLGDFALFMALKDENEGKPWTLWEEDVKYRKEEVLKDKANELAQEICYYEFLQFEFYRQWLELKNYANSQGVEIIGDIPIYVSMDSADAWAGKELFQFDEHARPKQSPVVRRTGSRRSDNCGGTRFTIGITTAPADLPGGCGGFGFVSVCMMWCVSTIFAGLTNIMRYRMARWMPEKENGKKGRALLCLRRCGRCLASGKLLPRIWAM